MAQCKVIYDKKVRNIWGRVNEIGLSYKAISFLILLSLISTITEIFGIGIFLPIFQFIQLKGDLNALVESFSFWGYVIDWFSYFGIEPSLVSLLLLSFGFFLFRQIATFFRLIYKAAVTQRLAQLQRNKIFSGYIKADTSYHDSTPVGNLVNVITTEVNSAVTGIMAPIELMVYLIMLAGYIGMLFFLSWEMTLVSIIVLLLSSQVPKMWIKESKTTGRNLVDANILMSDFLVSRLKSPRLVRLSRTEIAETKEFHLLTQSQCKYSVFGSILKAKTEVVMEPIVIGLSFIFLYFSYTLLNLQIEVIGLYMVVAMRLMPIVKGVISQWQSLQSFIGSIEAIEDRFRTLDNHIEKNAGVENIVKLEGSVLFNNVSYCYPTEKNNALSNISIEIKPNEITAIVGPSGSGKSTLVDLLPRLRPPTHGSISFNNKSVERYTLESVRKLISYVPQQPQIFDGKVRDHILYGKRDATDQEVYNASKLAGAYDFITQLSQGFDTILGDEAVKLSGGQRQRLDLARALVSESKILILDEPTSNLDAESENKFMNAISRIHQETDTLIVIVAHRLSSVKNADRIIVLNQGRVDSVGTHDTLLKVDGWYSKAWKIQNLVNNT
jgi:ABC-type multidrug transport system fused ATPase/permease subunit